MPPQPALKHLHTVKVDRPGKPVRWYVYAWRGGPCILSATGGARPALTPAAIEAWRQAVATRYQPGTDTLAGLVAAFKASPEFARLAESSRRDMMWSLDAAVSEFGAAPLGALADRRMRGEVLAWRDRRAHQPRTADKHAAALARVLAWAVERGQLPVNVLANLPTLYAADRAEVIWEAADFAAFRTHASREVWQAIELAALTGLARADLVALPWAAVGERAIVWRRAKTNRPLTVPLLPSLRELLAELPRRAETVLTNSRGQPWTPSGLEASFCKARARAGVTKRLHDLRGTFATRCVEAGMTDQDVATLLGWSPKNVAAIRAKYVDHTRTVVALAERFANAGVKRL